MVAIQLWRWFLFHVGFGSMPIMAAVLFPVLFPNQSGGKPGVGEVLFLAFMLSSLTFADIVELVADRGLNNLRLLLLSFLLIGVGLCLLLYGANKANESYADQSFMLEVSGAMVALFFVVGTLVQWVFWLAKKKGDSRTDTKNWKLI